MPGRPDHAPHAPGAAQAVLSPSTAVLLVDDQDSALVALEAAFTGASYDVVAARSGQEALLRLLERDFAAVVLDVRMPGMDGFEAARLIRSRAKTRHLPILFLTGYDLDADASVRAYGLGAVDLVSKPVRPEVLRAKVDVFVQLHEREREARASRARFDSLAALAPVGVFQADEEGGYVWVNPRWSELTGRAAEDALDRGWVTALHPDDRERVVAEWDVAAREGRPFHFEFRLLRPDGKVTWVLGQSRTERDAAGRVSGHVGTITDIDDQKRAEEVLRRCREDLAREVDDRARELRFANEELGLITEHLPVLISAVGADERYIRVSRGYERWFGRPADSMEGRHLREVLGEAAYQLILPHVRAALAGHEVTFDLPVPYEGGGYRHIRASYVPRRDRAGRVAGFVALVIDITDAKRAEAELRHREGELADFFENGAVGCHWLSPEGAILRANRTELRMLGYAPEEYVGRRMAEFYDDPRVVDGILARLARKEEIRELPVRLRAKDGSIRHALLDASGLWKDGRYVHARCFTRDMTDHRAAELAVARLAAIVESSEDAIVGKTLDGTVTSWNQSAQRLFGYAPEEIIGKSITLLIPEELRSEEEMILSRLRRGERVVHYETRRRTKDGRLLEISLSVSPIKDREGRIVGASKVARDITERARTEREIRRLNAELEDRVRERTRALETTARELDAFAYTVSHDLRAPLRTMHRYSDIVLEEYAGRILDEEGQDFLRRIGRASRQMDDLIQNLLTYSRLGRDAVELAEFPLDAALHEALEALAGDIQERNARILRESPLPAVRADKVLLGQVFTNLISNALRFTEPGVPPVVRVRAERRGAAVRVWVEDNGVGIDPTYHERIFRIFERLNPREFAGTGIGLAIVKRAMERMRGEIGLESTLGRGSSFWIQFSTER